MARSSRYLLLFFALAFAELAVLFAVGHMAGWRVMLGESLLLAALGLAVLIVVLARYAHALLSRLNAHEPLDDDLVGGVVLMVAGILLIVPGIITDAIAIVLLLPSVRRLVVSRLHATPPLPVEGKCATGPASAGVPRDQVTGTTGGRESRAP